MTKVPDGLSLDATSPMPLYYQAAQALEQAIEDGRLVAGSKLPNELDLAKHLGISRGTMRAGFRTLVDKGLLVRRRGIGTIVAPKPVTRDVALSSLYDDLAKAGREPKTRVLAFEEAPCTPEIGEYLGLESGTPVLRFDRLRMAGSSPICLMHNVIPSDLIEISREDLEQGGLYELLRRNGVTPQIAKQQVGALNADAGEAELLGIKQGDPLLTTRRVAYDIDGRPIEYGFHRYPAETFTFETVLRAV